MDGISPEFQTFRGALACVDTSEEAIRRVESMLAKSQKSLQSYSPFRHECLGFYEGQEGLEVTFEDLMENQA
jgi:hypothetical protein